MSIDQVKVEVNTAQGILDKIVPGKVKVKAEYDSERRCHILIGEYDTYWKDNYHEFESKSTWTESMDRFYSDCKLFVGFFKQRAKYMNASIEEQRSFKGHPATF